MRIVPPKDVTIDPAKRPFVVVDPRAGHGPGIGGFKADSEVGVALKAGHPCYFIGFMPEPMDGQTIEDIARAEAVFLETVIARHPAGRRQALRDRQLPGGMGDHDPCRTPPRTFRADHRRGLATLLLGGRQGPVSHALFGRIARRQLADSDLGDLGQGKFDGAWLVQNFENQNPANTLWSKQYNLYSKIDTEAARYLGFERWWGGHVTLNAEEMQFIVDELFVGNKLAAGEIRASDGTTVDLRNIRSPIVVFCSKGDNITPPQQALDWILDLYDSVEDIRAHGQTIVYTVHDKIGHLGIFVSAGVARKEHDEFASNIDMIDVLPPGLYEAVLTPKDSTAENADLVTGNWVMDCEPRTLEDIRKLGGNDLEDERRFAAAARLSEINLSLYRAFAQPIVKAMANPAMAEAMRRLHPLRLQYEIFGPANPFTAWIAETATRVREERQPVASDNPFLAMQEQVSRQIVEGSGDLAQAPASGRRKKASARFLGLPGFRLYWASTPTRNARRERRRRTSCMRSSSLHASPSSRARSRKAACARPSSRSLTYVGMARGGVDERGFEAVQRLRRAQPAAERLPLAEFKALDPRAVFHAPHRRRGSTGRDPGHAA